MSTARLFPNNIAPYGDTVRTCLENDDEEIRRILNLLHTTAGNTAPTNPVDGTAWYELIATSGNIKGVRKKVYNGTRNQYDTWHYETETAYITDCAAKRAELTNAINTARTQLQSNLDTVNTNLTNLINENARTAADNLDAVDTRLTNLINATARTAADNLDAAKRDLTGKINTVQGNLDTASANLTRQINAVNSDLTGKINTVQGNLDTANTRLTNKINDDVAAARTDYNSKISNLSGELDSAKDELQDSIDGIETSLSSGRFIAPNYSGRRTVYSGEVYQGSSYPSGGYTVPSNGYVIASGTPRYRAGGTSGESGSTPYQIGRLYVVVAGLSVCFATGTDTNFTGGICVPVKSGDTVAISGTCSGGGNLAGTASLIFVPSAS